VHHRQHKFNLYISIYGVIISLIDQMWPPIVEKNKKDIGSLVYHYYFSLYVSSGMQTSYSCNKVTIIYTNIRENKKMIKLKLN